MIYLYQWFTPGWHSEPITPPTVPDPERRCSHCGGPYYGWTDPPGEVVQHCTISPPEHRFPPLWTCARCLDQDQWYGDEEIEVAGFVVELDKNQIPIRQDDRRSEPGCKPRWEIKGRKLVVKGMILDVPQYCRSKSR